MRNSDDRSVDVGDGDAEAVHAPPPLSIGLALSGGAARGFAHIGVIRTLLAAGYQPEVIAGTSIGAIIGGVYAAGFLDQFEAWTRELNRRRVFGYLDFSLAGSGLIGGDRLFAQLDDTLNGITFEQLPVRLVAVATELRTSHEIWLRGAAGDLSALAPRRALADGWRAGQSVADLGGARARRAARHRRQRQRR
jgi:NTE family protein